MFTAKFKALVLVLLCAATVSGIALVNKNLSDRLTAVENEQKQILSTPLATPTATPSATLVPTKVMLPLRKTTAGVTVVPSVTK